VDNQITAAPLDGARSISSVLHGRLQRLVPPELAGYEVTWAQRTPAGAPAVAHELAAGLDDRAWALGDQMTASPEPWLARHLGVLAPTASPALREEYARRAAAAAAYREAAGITDSQQAVSLLPHFSSPELEDMRLAAIRALEIRGEADIIRGLTHGELEARTLKAERAQATAPPDVSRQLRLTAQAEADAWKQSADAVTRHNEAEAANAKTLADQLAAERQQLEAANVRYEQWSAATTTIRETAAKARAELERRCLVRQPAEPSQPQAANELEADVSAIDHDVEVEREHQVAVTFDGPGLPERTPQPELVCQNAAASPEFDVRPRPITRRPGTTSYSPRPLKRSGVLLPTGLSVRQEPSTPPAWHCRSLPWKHKSSTTWK